MLKKMGIDFILLQKSIGALEVTCGILMTPVPGSPKDVANFSLLLLVLGVLFFHRLVSDPLKAHALVFEILLTCHLLITHKPEDGLLRRRPCLRVQRSKPIYMRRPHRAERKYHRKLEVQKADPPVSCLLDTQDDSSLCFYLFILRGERKNTICRLIGCVYLYPKVTCPH